MFLLYNRKDYGNNFSFWIAILTFVIYKTLRVLQECQICSNPIQLDRSDDAIV